MTKKKARVTRHYRAVQPLSPRDPRDGPDRPIGWEFEADPRDESIKRLVELGVIVEIDVAPGWAPKPLPDCPGCGKDEAEAREADAAEAAQQGRNIVAPIQEA